MANSNIFIKTDRFILRLQTVEEAIPQYVKWLDEQSNQGFIVSAKQKEQCEAGA